MHTGSQRVRIIAGQWRHRWLSVAAHVRPTPNRVRETLFNWLQHDMVGARCLDAYGGTGALAFEALSRGAKHCVLCEIHPQALRCIQAAKQTLQADALTICPQSFETQAWADRAPFDVIFLDPPFVENVLTDNIKWIETHGLIIQGGVIYCSWHDFAPQVSSRWSLVRTIKTQQVHGGLFRYQAVDS